MTGIPKFILGDIIATDYLGEKADHERPVGERTITNYRFVWRVAAIQTALG